MKVAPGKYFKLIGYQANREPSYFAIQNSGAVQSGFQASPIGPSCGGFKICDDQVDWEASTSIFF